MGLIVTDTAELEVTVDTDTHTHTYNAHNLITQSYNNYESNGDIISSSSVQGSMQLQYCLIKWRNPNMVDTIIFSTSIYSISVMFADVITIVIHP